LILENLPQALQAHAQLREVDEHRFTDSDLHKIILGATLGINAFHKLSAGEIRRICIENHERLEQVRDFFSGGPAEEEREALGKLREQIGKADKPWCWMLDHDPQAVVRAFTLSAIMHQHGIEYDVLLDNFQTGLGRYQKIPKLVIEQTIQDMLQADPDQITEDVGAVENFLKEEPDKRLAFLLADRCKIDEPEQAKAVLLAEKLSGLVRSLTLLSLRAERQRHPAERDPPQPKGDLGRLSPEQLRTHQRERPARKRPQDPSGTDSEVQGRKAGRRCRVRDLSPLRVRSN